MPDELSVTWPTLRLFVYSDNILNLVKDFKAMLHNSYAALHCVAMLGLHLSFVLSTHFIPLAIFLSMINYHRSTTQLRWRGMWTAYALRWIPRLCWLLLQFCWKLCPCRVALIVELKAKNRCFECSEKYHTGLVISCHLGLPGEEKIICFYSHSLSRSQRSYCTTHHKLPDIASVLGSFKEHLLWTKCLV
jgi:hypothetical protein